MELRISELAKQYPASGIRKMFDLAAGYDDVIALTLGEPNFETPAYIKEAAKKALDENYTHYAPNAGLPVLRQAVADRYQSYWDGYKADNVVVTVGALEGLTLCLLALLNRDDEILVPDPCFANYYGQAMIAGAKAVPVPAHEGNGFNMTAADVEKCITPKTKAIILNSPCNPTGAVMSREDVLAIAEVVKKHDLWVFSDEPYDAIVYDGVEAFSMAQVDDVRDHVIVLNSFSKTYAMTGWRLGYVAGPADLIEAIGKINENSCSCVNTAVQWAGIEALSGEQTQPYLDMMVASFQERRDVVYQMINEIPGLSCVKPQGAFYAFVNIAGTGMKAADFATKLLRNYHVGLVPGTGFGPDCENYVRISYATSMENICEGIRRIGRFVADETAKS